MTPSPELNSSLDDPADLLDLLAVDGAGAADHLEAVVLRGVVASGDHDRAVGLGADDRVVEHRGGNHADVGDRAAGGGQPPG